MAVESAAAGHLRARTTPEWERALGEQVRDLRVRAGLTQAELARAANLGTATVGRLETGQGGTLGSFIDVLRVLGQEDWLDGLAPVATVSPIELARAQDAERRRKRVRVRRVE
jgi:transcriptional regulator with XRE-family HTH domain